MAVPTHVNILFKFSFPYHEDASSRLILTCLCLPAHRARLRALPHGGQHLHRLCGGRLPGGSLLLHLLAAQTADPTAYSLLPAQLPGWDHPHDPHHRAPEPPCPVATVQHSHHQLKFGRRRQLHAEVFSGRSGAAAWLPGVCHRLLVSLHPHPDPSNSASTSTSPLHIPARTHVRRHPASSALQPQPQPHPHPAAATPALDGFSPLAGHRVPSAAAVLLPPAAWRLHSSQGLCWLRTELTGLPAGEIEGLQDLEVVGCPYGHCNTAGGVWVEGPVRLNGHRASNRRTRDKAQQSCRSSVMWPEAFPHCNTTVQQTCQGQQQYWILCTFHHIVYRIIWTIFYFFIHAVFLSWQFIVELKSFQIIRLSLKTQIQAGRSVTVLCIATLWYY